MKSTRMLRQGDDEEDDQKWLAVIGRCLAFLCLDKADLRSEKLSMQASFLERLGIERKDAAKLLDTTGETLRVMAHNAKKTKKGGGRGRKERRGA